LTKTVFRLFSLTWYAKTNGSRPQSPPYRWPVCW